MANTITLDELDWAPIKAKIQKERGENFFLISWVVKRELGFTVRRGRGGEYDVVLRRVRRSICLDFFDDELETYFRLKYL